MSFSGHASDWERHQRSEIHRFVKRSIADDELVKKFMPLYPGSMLFNQIAVTDNIGLSDSDLFAHPRFESLDAVYGALGISTDSVVNNDSLLIDCQCWSDRIETIMRREIQLYRQQHGPHLSVVLLSGRHSGRIKSLCKAQSIHCSVITPRWWCAASLLRLYRESAHVVFVNTARSLDAAMIGAACSLIVSDSYEESPLFPALLRALSSLTCCSVMLPKHTVDTALGKAMNISVVENRHDELLAAINAVCDSEYKSRGFDCSSADCQRVDSQSPDAVVRTGVFWQQLLIQNAANIRVSIRRKSRKLVEDPRAFFRDSRLPGTSAIAAIFPEITREVDPDITERHASKASR